MVLLNVFLGNFYSTLEDCSFHTKISKSDQEIQRSQRLNKQTFPLYYISIGTTLCSLRAVGNPRSENLMLDPPLSEQFWRHCVLNGGTQRRALARQQSEEMKILNILFIRVGIESTTRHVYSHVGAHAPRWPPMLILCQKTMGQSIDK